MSEMYKLWNKRTLYEIYFRPLDDSNVEVITYFSGDPFVNPRSKRKDEDDANVEVWSVEDARENWDAWVNHGGYEVSEVEDYLKNGRVNSRGESMNYIKENYRQYKKNTGSTKRIRMYNE